MVFLMDVSISINLTCDMKASVLNDLVLSYYFFAKVKNGQAGVGGERFLGNLLYSVVGRKFVVNVEKFCKGFFESQWNGQKESDSIYWLEKAFMELGDTGVSWLKKIFFSVIFVEDNWDNMIARVCTQEASLFENGETNVLGYNLQFLKSGNHD